jgi:hypothetical protein
VNPLRPSQASLSVLFGVDSLFALRFLARLAADPKMVDRSVSRRGSLGLH